MSTTLGDQFADLVRARVTALGGSVRAIELAHNLKEDSIRNIIKEGDRRTVPSLDKAQEICDALGLYINIGPPAQKDIFTNYAALNKLTDQIFGNKVIVEADFAELGPEYAAIPLRETQVSAGSGMSDHGIDVVGTIAFRRAWLRRLGIQADEATLIRVRGDSMRPDLHDGDVILVDQAARTIVSGAVYVLRVGGDLFVKRLYRAGAQIIAVSDNPAYQPFALDPSLDDQGVEGRVRWSARELTAP